MELILILRSKKRVCCTVKLYISPVSSPHVTYFIHGTGKAFGVTDFINPNVLSEPVQQVFYSTQLGTCSSLTFEIVSFFLIAYMKKLLSYKLIIGL